MDQKGVKSSLPKWQIYKSTLATLVNSENFAMVYEKISLWVNFAMGYDRVRRKFLKKYLRFSKYISTKWLVLLSKFLEAGFVELNFLFVFHRV